VRLHHRERGVIASVPLTGAVGVLLVTAEASWWVGRTSYIDQRAVKSSSAISEKANLYRVFIDYLTVYTVVDVRLSRLPASAGLWAHTKVPCPG
jgi:hypothetical protein